MRGTSEKTRRTILRAANKLFYGQGIRNVSVDAVAIEAGITKRTLYYHFKGKSELVAAYLESRNTPILTHLQNTMTSVDGDVRYQIKALFADLGHQLSSPSWRGCPFARAVSEFPADLNHATLEIAANHKKTFEDWLHRRFAKEGFGKPKALARQIMVLIDGAITQMLIHRDAAYARAAGSAAETLIVRSDTRAGN